MMTNSYTAKVLEILDDGSAVLELPDELCVSLGWVEGTNLSITMDENSNIILEEIKK
jgi:antitoxin component of MazEF toxin-antitoxin module